MESHLDPGGLLKWGLFDKYKKKCAKITFDGLPVYRPVCFQAIGKWGIFLLKANNVLKFGLPAMIA